MRCPLTTYCHCLPLSHELKVFLILSTSQNVPCRYFYVLSIVRNRIFVNSCLGDRGDWRSLLLFMSILQLLAGLCLQLTKEQKKTEVVAYIGEEACVCICKGLGIQRLFTTAASFIMGSFSRRSSPTCQKDHHRVFSCP